MFCYAAAALAAPQEACLGLGLPSGRHHRSTHNSSRCIRSSRSIRSIRYRSIRSRSIRSSLCLTAKGRITRSLSVRRHPNSTNNRSMPEQLTPGSSTWIRAADLVMG